mmetsp:Transcript_27916/g.63925  ORF Transcript_27916/g.63925 Transcript_27916/m.63925 type:complete len:118 (+) Transcript_27916:878-1231(+)
MSLHESRILDDGLAGNRFFSDLVLKYPYFEPKIFFFPTVKIVGLGTYFEFEGLISAIGLFDAFQHFLEFRDTPAFRIPLPSPMTKVMESCRFANQQNYFIYCTMFCDSESKRTIESS